MQKIVAGVTTKYLVATVNPTGYPQVVYETFSGTGITEYWRQFVYGLDRISQYRSAQSGTQKSFYVYDGHGSVRALTDQNGNVTDTYDYDAFGNVTHQTGTTPNEFLFAGEQLDSNLHLYYNRARYLNTTTGRFWSMDTYDGDPQSPLSLHKYLYVQDDSVDALDPSGLLLLPVTGSSIFYGNLVHEKLTEEFLEDFRRGLDDTSLSNILGVPAGPFGNLRPDLTNPPTAEIYEISTALNFGANVSKVLLEVGVLDKYDPRGRSWLGGASFVPTPLIKLDPVTFAIVDPPIVGVIEYSVINAGEIALLAAIAVRSMEPQLDTETASALTFAAEGVF